MGRSSGKVSGIIADRLAPRQDHGPERLAAWSALGGLLTALAVVALSGRFALDQRASGDTALGALGFSVALAAPFVAALASFLLRDRGVRRAVWAACGLLGLILGGLTIFSGVGWLFGAAGVGLVAAWWQTRDRAGDLATVRGVAVTVWLLFWLAGALAMLWLYKTPVCWEVSDNGSGRSAKNITTMCSSDITDDAEGALALVAVAIGLAGMAFAGRGNNSVDGVRGGRAMRRRLSSFVADLFRMARRSLLLSLFLAITLANSVGARQATPLASPTAIDLGECTTEPRSNDEMRALIEIGLPPVLALFAGTPTASDGATPLPTRVPGAPADEEKVAAVTETILQFMACNNAGNLPAAVSLLTDQAAGSYLAFAFMPFREIYAGMTGTPTADVDPGLIDMYLGTMQLRSALPPEFQIHLYNIESVTQLENGRVRVIVLQATGSGELEESYFLLREVDGQYRIMFGPEEEGEAASTPAP